MLSIFAVFPFQQKYVFLLGGVIPKRYKKVLLEALSAMLRQSRRGRRVLPKNYLSKLTGNINANAI